MSTEINKRMARDYYALIDREGPASGHGYIGPGYAYHGANHTGFENLTPAGMGKAFYTAFPDFTHIVLDQIGEGDCVVERIRYFATHRGTFMGIAATGRKVTFTGMDWVRFEDGKIVERWGIASEDDLRRQLLGLGLPRQAETQKLLAREYYDVIDSQGPVAGIPYDGENALYHGANHTGFDANGPDDMARLFYTAFPDFTHVVMDQVTEGDIVIERIRYFATHLGTFMGIAATGRTVTFTGMDWVRFEDGRIAQRWGVADELELRRQLLGLADLRPEQRRLALANDYALIAGRYGQGVGKAFGASASDHHRANHTGFDDAEPGSLSRIFMIAFPDFASVVLDRFEVDDTVVERGRCFGTHLGTYMGIAATGRTVTYTESRWTRLLNGKAIERWIVADEIDLRRQLLGVSDPAQTDTNKALAREYYEVKDRYGQASGNLYGAVNVAYYGANHTGFADTDTGGHSRAQAFHRAFPDYTHVIMDQIGEGDIVVERIRYFATHSDTFMGIPATGRKITYTGMDWVRLENGRVAERWGVPGALELRRALLGLSDPNPLETEAALMCDFTSVTDRYGAAAGKVFEEFCAGFPATVIVEI